MECGDYLPALNELWGVILTSLGVTEDQVNSTLKDLNVSELVNGAAGDAITGLLSGGGDEASTSEPASTNSSGSVKGRRLLNRGPIVQEDAPAKQNSDALGNVFPTETTESSTASFEWIYTVLKGGQSVVMLAEIGVDGEQVWEAWIHKKYYDAGNFIGSGTFILLDEVVELWNTFVV